MAGVNTYFFRKSEEILNSGDPEVRTWFMVRQGYLPFILCGAYVLFSTVIGPAIMRNRNPFNLRSIMIVFNFFIVATYISSLAVVLWNIPSMTETKEAICKSFVIKKGNFEYKIATAAWVIYMLKYVEMLDTVFFVLRKKQNQITFLHVMHHTIVPILGWIGFRTVRSGLQPIPGLINVFVHIIMYSYYGLAAMGPQVRKYLWWKKYLTQLQMIQFILIFVFVTILMPLSGCSMVATSYLIDIVMMPIFLYLFYNYYKKNFMSNRKDVACKSE